VKLDSNNHSVFALHYHLVMCIKYRRKVINDSISNRLKDIFIDISPNYGVELIKWNHDNDHVHLLFKAKPNTEISKLINAYKSASSRRIKNEFPSTRKYLWKEYFWSKSYCLVTTGGAPLEVVKQYIENQGK
jgi:putative transposase